MLHYCTFCWAQLIHLVNYLLLLYEYLRYFKRNQHDTYGALSITTGSLPKGPTTIPHHVNQSRNQMESLAKSMLFWNQEYKFHYCFYTFQCTSVNYHHVIFRSVFWWTWISTELLESNQKSRQNSLIPNHINKNKW